MAVTLKNIANELGVSINTVSRALRVMPDISRETRLLVKETAARLGISLSEATLYCTHQPCVICAKMIINSGIKRIVFKYGYPDEFAMQLFKAANVSVDQYDEE